MLPFALTTASIMLVAHELANKGLTAMDNEDVNIVLIFNGAHAIHGRAEHTMKEFIASKKRQLTLQKGDPTGSAAKQPRVPDAQ